MELEQQATLLCDGDEFCLYDVAVTGLLEVGNLTKMTSQRRKELVDLSRPSKTSEKMPILIKFRDSSIPTICSYNA